SAMPAWSAEVGGPLNVQQIEAVAALVESWADEADQQPIEDVPDTVEAGAEVYTAAGCVACHGPDLAGGTAGPNIQTIGSGVITEFENFATPSGVDQMVADYEADPRMFLEKWIRDSAANYNDGNATGMPAHSEGAVSESALQALITFLLDQTGG
ncbi:MAG: c-type cytochrome, partial [Candidatus Limnocylindria bacterium]